jgi:hypothetical protein
MWERPSGFCGGPAAGSLPYQATSEADRALAAVRLGYLRKYASSPLIQSSQVRITGGIPPEKQLQLALFLASDHSNHISGKLIHVNDDWRRFEACAPAIVARKPRFAKQMPADRSEHEDSGRFSISNIGEAGKPMIRLRLATVL